MAYTSEKARNFLAAVHAGRLFPQALPAAAWRVHSVFDRALNLSDGYNYLSLLALERGCGAWAASLAGLGEGGFVALGIRPGEGVAADGPVLRVGEQLAVDCGQARIWQTPLPATGAPAGDYRANLDLFRQALARRGAAERAVFWPALAGDSLAGLRLGCVHADRGLLAASLKRLVGLGPGLTPSGDDLLLGLARVQALFGVSHAWAAELGSLLDRTTGLSAFLLRQALAGEGHQFVEEALAAVIGGGAEEIDSSVRRLLSLGYASGADIAVGLCLGLAWRQEAAGAKFGSR